MDLTRLSDRNLALRYRGLQDQADAAEGPKHRDPVKWREATLAIVDVLEEYDRRTGRKNPQHTSDLVQFRAAVEAGIYV